MVDLKSALVIAVAAWAGLGASAVRAAECGEAYGDVTASGGVDVVDVQCGIKGVLGALAGTADPPPCLAGGWEALDVSCSEPVGIIAGPKSANLVDVQLLIVLALGAPLGAAVDLDADGCADACQAECGDAACDAAHGETCAGCPADCGQCADACCAEHDSPGCVQPDVEACVCAITDFCCEFYWDSSCVAVAKEFCGLACFEPACAISGQVSCGSTLSATTVGAPSIATKYSCVDNLATGPEVAYLFTAPSDTLMRMHVAPKDGAALDAIVLGAECDSKACLGSGFELTEVAVQGGQTYYLVVDSSQGDAGAFELSVTCATDCDFAAECGDAVCGTVECQGFVYSCGKCPLGTACEAGECVESPIGACPGPGDCTVSNGSPGCSDKACCTLVCAFDPFCCATSWDAICADEAVQNCGTACGDGICDAAAGETCAWCSQDCGCGVGTGCSGDTCLSCTAANFCGGAACGTATCGGVVVDCGSCGPGSVCFAGECFAEGTCAASAALECGSAVSGTTAGSTSDLQIYPCYDVFADGGEVAYVFTAPKTGDVQVSLTASKGPLMMWILEGSCEAASCLTAGAYEVIFEAEQGITYYIVVDDKASSMGDFSLKLICEDQCTEEQMCAGSECGSVPCVNTIIDCGTCALGSYCAGGQCLPVGAFPQCPSPGSCYVSHGSPGCDNIICCNKVCNLDVFCCDVAWDGICAEEAQQYCSP